MYEDKDPWPFRCPDCGKEFTEEIGRLKTQSPNVEVRCPGKIGEFGPIPCSTTIRYGAEQFGLMLTEAQAGRFDPFGKFWILKQRP
jgi:hypothetical protein